jgi:SAM-dependent methyltransferase
MIDQKAYWDRAADGYDRDFTGTLTGRARRHSVWRDLERAFHPGQRILELNCGTGIDALHLAARGIRVLGCDISPRMIQIALQAAEAEGQRVRLDFRVLPTEDLAALETESPFDGAFFEHSAVARQLGGNHRRESMNWSELPFPVTRSAALDIPVPQFASRVRGNGNRDGPQIGKSHAVHGLYQCWRQSVGRLL